MTRAEILIGYDGSEESANALRWAVREARLRKMPLVICHVWHWPFAMSPSVSDTLERFRLHERHTAESGAIIARGTAPGLHASARAVRGPAAATLLGLSGQAGMLVVGHRGNEGFDDLLVGAVAAQLAAHAYCPLVVVRKEPVPSERGLVVAGVDGSPAGNAVLAFAFREAALHGVGVHLVFAVPRSPGRRVPVPGTPTSRSSTATAAVSSGPWHRGVRHRPRAGAHVVRHRRRRRRALDVGGRVGVAAGCSAAWPR